MLKYKAVSFLRSPEHRTGSEERHHYSRWEDLSGGKLAAATGRWPDFGQVFCLHFCKDLQVQTYVLSWELSKEKSED